MKNVAKIAILFASTCVVTGSALAQQEPLRADVPFNFTVGSTTLPAGTYRISSVSDSWIVKLQSVSGKGQVLTMSQPASSHPPQENTVVFHRVGTQYFLSDIRGGRYSMNVHVHESKAESRAKAQILEAGLRPSDNIMIALR